MSTNRRDVFDWPEFMEAMGVLVWVLLFAGCIIGAIVEAAQ